MTRKQRKTLERLMTRGSRTWTPRERQTVMALRTLRDRETPAPRDPLIRFYKRVSDEDPVDGPGHAGAAVRPSLGR